MTYKPPSKIAERVYKALLKSGFTIIPEVNVGERLRLDFVVREISLAVEVDGRQHESMNAFMHGDKDGFRDSKRRDSRKEELCAAEGLHLIRLSEKEVMSAANADSLLALILSKITYQESEEEW